jgi:hypothetical protein
MKRSKLSLFMTVSFFQGCSFSLLTVQPPDPPLDTTFLEEELEELADAIDGLSMQADLLEDAVRNVADGLLSEPTLTITVEGIVTVNPDTGEFELTQPDRTNECGSPVVVPLPDPVALEDELCTRNPMKLRIELSGMDPLHILFGPNPDEVCSYGAVQLDHVSGSLRPAFEVESTWIFFWGRLPRTRSRWVVLDVPGTTGVHQILTSGEERVFLIGPEKMCSAASPDLNCTIPPPSGAATAMDCRIVAACDTIASDGLSCSNFYLSITPTDADSDGNLDTCVIATNTVDGLSTAEKKQLEDWKAMAAAAGWDSKNP